mgnify:CR=1 FL=1
MDKFAKWLGAGVGFTFGGPIGAILGYVLGSFIDGFSIQDFLQEQEAYHRRPKQQKTVHATSGDFEMYGKARANHAFKLFKGIIKRQISTRQVCLQIRQHLTHSSRLQLIHFLFGIAKADGNVTSVEEQEIRKIASYFYINGHDYNSIKAMFYDESDSAYKILEITKTATNDDIKKAYRKMAKKYHPDKLQNLGEEHHSGAKEKFQNIQSAYEQIKAERGMP